MLNKLSCRCYSFFGFRDVFRVSEVFTCNCIYCSWPCRYTVIEDHFEALFFPMYIWGGKVQEDKTQLRVAGQCRDTGANSEEIARSALYNTAVQAQVQVERLKCCMFQRQLV